MFQLVLLTSLLSCSSTVAFTPLPQHSHSVASDCARKSAIMKKNKRRLLQQRDLPTVTKSNTLMMSAQATMTSMTEEQARYILNKARECAFADGNLVDDIIEHGGPVEHSPNPLDDMVQQVGTTAAPSSPSSSSWSSSNIHFTADDARYLLREMIHIQSSCVTGQVIGKDLCDDQDTAADIVARLRFKIDNYERRLAKRQKGSDSAVPLVATELSVGALLLVVAIFWTTLDMTGGPINGGDIVDDMVAATSSSSSSSSLELNNFNDWLGVLQERYLGAKDASTSSV